MSMIFNLATFGRYMDLYESADPYQLDLNESSISPLRFKDSDLDDIIEFVDALVNSTGSIDITEKVAGQHITVNIKSGFVTVNTKDSLLHGTGDKNANKTHYGSELTKPLMKYLQHSKLPDQSWSFEIVNPKSNHDYIRYEHDDTIYIEYTGQLSEEVAKELRKTLNGRLLTRNDIRVKVIQNQDFLDFKRDWEMNTRKRFTSMDKGKKTDYYYRSINMLKFRISELFEKILVSVVDNKSPVEGIVANTKTSPFKLQSNSFLTVQRVQMPMYSVFKIGAKEIDYVLNEPLKTFYDLKNQHGLALTSIYKGHMGESLYTIIKNYLAGNRKLKDIDTAKYRVWLTVDESEKLFARLSHGNVKQVYQELYSMVK